MYLRVCPLRNKASQVLARYSLSDFICSHFSRINRLEQLTKEKLKSTVKGSSMKCNGEWKVMCTGQWSGAFRFIKSAYVNHMLFELDDNNS